jgi:hypothetical protein
MAYLEKYSDEHYAQARILKSWEPLDAAPNGAHRVCIAVAINILLLRSYEAEALFQ